MPAIAALEAAGRPYRIVLETLSLSARRVAVTGGIGIACRIDALMGLDPEIHDGLLALPRVAYVLRINAWIVLSSEERRRMQEEFLTSSRVGLSGVERAIDTLVV